MLLCLNAITARESCTVQCHGSQYRAYCGSMEQEPDTPQQYGTGTLSKQDVSMRQYDSMGTGTNFSMARFRNWY